MHDSRIESNAPWLSKNGVRRDIATTDAPFAAAWLATIGDRQVEAARLTRLFLDGASTMAVRVRLDALGPELWSRALLTRYRQARLRDDREDCVRAATGLARDSMVARELGVTALADRSWSVRYRAHQLLAYSLDNSMVPVLRVARRKETRPELLDSIDAATKSIKKWTYNLFLDRRETGRVGWSANPWDARDPVIQNAYLKYILEKRREGWKTTL